MFKVVFSKCIWDGEDMDSSKSHAIYKKELELPFVPQPNIGIMWSAGTSVTPKTVSWDTEKEEFNCIVENEFKHWISCDEYDFEWLTSNAENLGWELVGKNNFSR